MEDEKVTGGVAQGWRKSDWDEAKSAGRILLVWKTAAGLSEHVELGKWSGSAWTNTYGKPFFGDPDGWAPLKPFAAQPPAAPVDTEAQATVEEIQRLILIEFAGQGPESRRAAERVWHLIDARAKTLARRTTTSVLPHPEGQGAECDGGSRAPQSSAETSGQEG